MNYTETENEISKPKLPSRISNSTLPMTTDESPSSAEEKIFLFHF